MTYSIKEASKLYGDKYHRKAAFGNHYPFNGETLDNYPFVLELNQ